MATTARRRRLLSSAIGALSLRGLHSFGGAGLSGGLTVLGLGRSTSASGEQQTATRPNILFVLADDMGYADLSCFGQPMFKTPVLDQLAADGLMLTQGYANSAVCSASRTALLTGRYQDRLPIGLYEPVTGAKGGGADSSIPSGHATIASILAKSGYRTSLIGKWHLGRYPDHSPLHSGYQYCFGFVGGSSDYFTHSGPYKRRELELWENDKPADQPGYLTDILAARAISEIDRAADAATPFFMSLHFNAPHWPWEGPGDADVARQLTDLRHYDGGSLKKYGEMVTRLDTAIGSVLEHLQQRDLARDTIVVFTSDNGGERYSDVWPFVGMKGELLEGGIRVPVIVRWPRRIAAGSHSSQVIAGMDWLPTLTAAAGARPDARYPSDGENLLPVLLGQDAVHPRTLFWRYKALAQAAVRDADWKYLRIDGKEFLFNLAEDQHERADLKERLPDVFQRLAQRFAAWEATMLPFPPDSYSENAKLIGKSVDRY